MGEACLDFFNVRHQFGENEAMACAQLTLQGIEQFLAAGFEALAGQIEHYVNRVARDLAIKEGGGRRH